MNLPSNDMYLLNSTTNEIAYLNAFYIYDTYIVLDLYQAKDLTTFQNPTPWDTIKNKQVYYNDRLSVIASNYNVTTNNLYYNMRKMFYEYLLTLSEFTDFTIQNIT